MMSHRSSMDQVGDQVRDQAGFTLFEVIVALVITGLISVVLIQGLGLVLAVRTSVAGKIIDLDQVILHRNFVLEPLRGIIPDYPDRPNVFTGSPRKLHGLTVRTLEERSGTPTGFTLSLDYNSDRGETIVLYEEDGHDPIEVMSWKGNDGAFSYRDHSGPWLDTWPTPSSFSQTPWVIRLEPGSGETPTLVAVVNGSHRRLLRLQDIPGAATQQD